jgi:integrase
LFPGFPPQLKHFEQKVKDTLAQAHAVSTRKAQCNAVFTLALFCMFFDVNFPKISIHTLLSFIVFLADNKLAVATVRNYVSSIKTRFKVLSISVEIFESPHVTLMFTSLSKSQVVTAPYKPNFSPTQFVSLANRVLMLPLGPLYHTAFVFAFLGLFRISNLAPASRPALSVFKGLRRKDVSILNYTISIFIRWTKTLQKYRQTARITLFQIPGSSVCPLKSFSRLVRMFPALPDDPLLSYRVQGKLIFVTQAELRRVLKQSLIPLNLSSGYTFHAFRRSGASLAFSAGVPFQAIQAHGTWTSEALWSYIHCDSKDPAVPALFAQVFSGL